MGSFNGWPISTMPSSPSAPTSIEWQLQDNQGEVESPFDYSSQIFDWQTARLCASLSYRPMKNSEALAWYAFLMGLNGIKGVFSFGDPLNQAPQNPGATAGTVTGSGQTGFTLVTSSSGLLPGDWFSLGLRLYRVTAADGGTLTIWPNIRESPADGTDLVITNTTGLFRLRKNVRGISIDKMRFAGITFEIKEAL